MRIGVIGMGAIGSEIAGAAQRGALGSGLDLVALLVRRARAAEPLVTTDLAEFLAAQPAVVVECAGHSALAQHGAACLRAGADLVVTSVGALTDDGLYERLRDTATAAGRRVIIASAGIGALDILAAAAVGGLQAVTVTVRKDPSAWHGTPGERLADLASLHEPITLFDGPVRAGAAQYPANVNIAAAAAFAGIGLDGTRLVIIVDPTIAEHVVEIEARGTFGFFQFREAVIPSQANPKTGRLVAMAIIKTLRQLASPVVVGW